MDKALRSVPGADAGDDRPSPDALLERAARLGFELASYRTETDQTVWEWRQGDGPRPQFVTERVARQWMTEWLAHQPPVVEPEPLEPHRRSRANDAQSAPTVAESA